MSPRILVTGAAGRLGRRVVTVLDDLGCDVLATDRVPASDSPCPFTQVDLLDHAAVAELVDGTDAVVHLGNHPGIGRRPPQVVLSENLTMNANVFQSAAEHGVGHIVFAGTIQLIGSHLDARTVVTEPARPQLPLDGSTRPDPSNLYSLSKSMSEDMLRYYADRCGMSVTVLRFPLLHDHAESVLVPSGQETATDVLEVFAGLSYDDAASAVAAVLRAPRPGYRVYLAAMANRHRDLDTDELIERFYPDAPAHEPRLADATSLMRDTGWQPSDDYHRPTEPPEASDP